VTETFSWRKYLRVHSAADKLPMMEEAELEELAEDIKANGLRTGITILGKKPDQPSTELPILIDGRNRLAAMAQAGLLAVNNQGHLCIRISNDAEQGLRLIKYNYRDGDPDKLSRSLNVIRRHLSPEVKRRLIGNALQADPTQSDRAVAKQINEERNLNIDHKTVGRVRHEQEDVGRIPTSDARTDTLGRQQPATKPAAPPTDPTDNIIKQILALFRQLDRDGRGKALDAIDRFFVSPFVTTEF
jgi:hypothetical protein